MAPLSTYRISVLSNGELSVSSSEPPIIKTYTGWYCLHAPEGGYANPVGMPAVRPALDANSPVKMTREIQWLSYELVAEFGVTKSKWRAFYGSTVWGTNNQSWYEKWCRDYINGLDLNSPDLPKLMKGIIFGGQLINGKPSYSVLRLIQNTIRLIINLPKYAKSSNLRKDFLALQNNNVIEVVPGIGAIDATKPIPDLKTVKDNNWFMQAVTSGSRIWNILASPVPLRAPYILNSVTHYPIEWFRWWSRDYLPNPLTANP